MGKSDFRFASDLANTMNWNMVPEDFKFSCDLEPLGCLVAFQGRERIGVATCVGFGKVGWFGNLVVKEKYRKMGAGSLLVRHAVDYLKGKGVETIGLYAYPNLTHFYSKLGFKADEDFHVLKADFRGSSTSDPPAKVEKQDIKSIEEFDKQFFVGNRNRLLESIIFEKGNLSYFRCESDEFIGYVAATVYSKMAWVGPLICREGRVDVAIDLLRTVFVSLKGKSAYLVLPKKESALATMLFDVGFKEDFSVTRMFLGQAVARNCIYMAESLERG